MSPHEPQERGPATPGPATSPGRSLRNLPGFTLAAIAFIMIVILGIGGAAVANWSQSGKVTIGITAGAAPTTSPSPTTSPTPTPSATPKPSPTPTPTPQPTVPVAPSPNIIVKPVILPRPGPLNEDSVTCIRANNSKDFTISWAGDASSYIVSLSASDANYGSPQSKTVTAKTVKFTIANTKAAYGSYILRIQPMKGTVAGDAIYKTLRHYQYDSGCGYANPAGRSPLGVFSFNASPANGEKTNNVLNLTWTAAAKATSYKVSIKARNSTYGAEFTVNSLGTTLIFPPKVLDQWKNPVETAVYFGQYDLRIQPMNQTQAGDPVVKVVQYQANNMNIW